VRASALGVWLVRSGAAGARALPLLRRAIVINEKAVGPVAGGVGALHPHWRGGALSER